MKYMLIWSTTSENRQATVDRSLKNQAPKDGLKFLQQWISLSTGRGFVVIETDDPVALKKNTNYWRDIMDISVEPIIDIEEARKVAEI